MEIGKYSVIAELGRGGMGDVYLALASGPAGFNKLVVLKTLRPEMAEDEAFRASRTCSTTCPAPTRRPAWT